MDKETILDNQKHGFNSGQRESALTAMDEWAEIRAITFIEWANENHYIQWFPTNKWSRDNDHNEYTTKQLYKLFTSGE